MLTKRVFSIAVTFLAAATASNNDSSRQPDIVIILTDDMGWNDVSFHGSDQVLTPNLDSLAYEGTILHQYYTHPICTPTRAALLTGHYASSTGLQGTPLRHSEGRALPRRFRLLPDHLRDLGYRTHLVGKWHLGAARPGDLPTARGFDSHFGYRGGFIDYFEYDLSEPLGNRTVTGFDLFHNNTIARDEFGYSTDLFTTEAVRSPDVSAMLEPPLSRVDEEPTTPSTVTGCTLDNGNQVLQILRVIKKANADPLFLMLSYNAPHSGNLEAFLQAPPATVRSQRRVKNSARRLYAATVRSVDAGVGSVISALQRKGRLDNAVIVFVSDNGAPTNGYYRNWGSNWPFRGLKETAWEGGVRVPAFIWSSSLPGRRRFDNLFHVSDWLPTFYSIAGGDPSTLNVEGVSQWTALKEESPPPRTSIFLDYDDRERAAAYREGDLKIVIGQYNNGEYDNYFGDSGEEDKLSAEKYASEISTCRTARVLANNKSLGSSLYSADHLAELRNGLRITCDTRSAPTTYHNCTSGCLFDVRLDPCESRDLSKDRPEDLKRLTEAIDNQIGKSVPSIPQIFDLRADPSLHGGVWLPWLPDDQ